jgi:hypothetical protein
MKSTYDTVVSENWVRVATEDVSFYLPVDEVNKNNIAENQYKVVFVLKSRHEVIWIYKSKDKRDAVLHILDTVVFAPIAIESLKAPASLEVH